MESISIIGLGWLGKACAQYFSSINFNVKATNRTGNAFENVDVYAWSLGHDLPSEINSDTILIALAPKEQDLANYEKLCNDLKKHQHKKIIFISTTSVYGKFKGLLTEDIDLNGSDNHNFQYAISNLFLKSFSNAVVLRLSGLVGPNRNPAKFLAGKKNLPNPNQKVNLVHQQDVINIIHKCIEYDLNGIYNVCSSVHPSRQEFYVAVCNRFNFEAPTFLDSNEEERIVSNEKLIKETSYQYIIDDVLKYYLSSEFKD